MRGVADVGLLGFAMKKLTQALKKSNNLNYCHYGTRTSGHTKETDSEYFERYILNLSGVLAKKIILGELKKTRIHMKRYGAYYGIKSPFPLTKNKLREKTER